MSHATVIELPGNFRERQLIGSDQLFGFLNFLQNHEILDGSICYFRKYIGQITIAVMKFVGQVFGSFNSRELFFHIHQFDYCIFYFLYKDAFLCLYNFNTKFQKILVQVFKMLIVDNIPDLDLCMADHVVIQSAFLKLIMDNFFAYRWYIVFEKVDHDEKGFFMENHGVQLAHSSEQFSAYGKRIVHHRCQ